MHQNTHERLNETKGEQSRVCGNFSDVNKPREALWLGSPMEMRSRLTEEGVPWTAPGLRPSPSTDTAYV